MNCPRCQHELSLHCLPCDQAASQQRVQELEFDLAAFKKHFKEVAEEREKLKADLEAEITERNKWAYKAGDSSAKAWKLEEKLKAAREILEELRWLGPDANCIYCGTPKHKVFHGCKLAFFLQPHAPGVAKEPDWISCNACDGNGWYLRAAEKTPSQAFQHTCEECHGIGKILPPAAQPGDAR